VAKSFGDELAQQPYHALVNPSNPDESRILRAPLAIAGGGWGQLEGGWSTREDPGYQAMRTLVYASLGAPNHRDGCGGCSQTPCECRSCWVRQARSEYRDRIANQAVDAVSHGRDSSE
jgi:hypothetical protein